MDQEPKTILISDLEKIIMVQINLLLESDIDSQFAQVSTVLLKTILGLSKLTTEIDVKELLKDYQAFWLESARSKN